MSKKAFDKIAEGLTEALSIARGETKPAKLHIPPEIDVRVIRARTGLSQDDFATRLRLHHQPDQGLGAGPCAAPRRRARLSLDHRA